jgi:DNA-binding transcriptional LysR family regulator
MAVAETGAVNGAAWQMEILPSAVSKHIMAQKNKLALNCSTVLHVRLL